MKVLHNNEHLGYIGRNLARIMASELDSEVIISGFVEEVIRKVVPEIRISLKISGG